MKAMFQKGHAGYPKSPTNKNTLRSPQKEVDEIDE